MFSLFQRNNSPVDKKNQRLLGSMENAYMKSSQKYQGLTRLCEVLHLQGPYISLETLSKAAGKLQQRHPTLRSRLQRNAQTAHSYYLEEDNTLQLKIIEIPRKRSDHQTFWKQEWRKREKSTTAIGDGLAEFWLLQDPEDQNDDNSPREIVFICEHSMCDALSLSNAAHELLIALTGEDDNLFAKSLDYPITMETAIQGSLSFVNRVLSVSKLVIQTLYTFVINRSPVAKIPLAKVDFLLTEMADHGHSEASYGILNKEETQKLVNKCRQEGVTVTSAVFSAVIYAISTLVNHEQAETSILRFGIVADPRRRYIPPIPNHDLCGHISSIMFFTIPMRDIPTTCAEMWQLARRFGAHTIKCIDANQVLTFGIITGKMYSKSLDSPNLPDIATCTMSSWGILPFREQYGSWKFEGMTPILNMIQGNMPFITFQTVNGILTIMFGGTDPVIPLNVLEQFSDCTIKKLHEMTED
ncbi:unnamed protein product [Adineta steineri]|uniref:Alcohol acetyltransferase n=1 Tax=Adineta steineri TaxID=433720 RepID=A0A819B6K5_9BILA|nr:unnamed protein product [Adineta steineri]CAF3796721.1 unnamed protein product [Adineta steineri]